MNRRSLLIGAAVAIAATAVPGLSAAAGRAADSEGSAEGVTGFKQILVVQCTVIDMINDTQRTISIENSGPIVISEGKKPFAISVSEDDADFLKLSILRNTQDGYVVEKTVGAGKNGMQILRGRGVILQFRTFED